MHRRTPIYVALLLLLFCLPPATARERQLTGTLKTVRGIRVLTLHGTDRQNGYTRGYLLAREIMDTVEGILALKLPKSVDYPTVSKRVLTMIERPEASTEELEAMVEGMGARLGAKGLEIPGLGRRLTADDLWVAMSMPDVHCSSYAAWGEMAAGGGLVIGRNTDYAGKERFAGGMLLVVHKSADPKRKSWIDASAAGMIGVANAISEDGAFIAVHDSASTRDPGTRPHTGFLRWTVTREFLETVSPTGDLDVQAAAFFRQKHILRGTNLLVCTPRPAARVVEYDGNLVRESGVTIRGPGPGQSWIAVTNHFRARTTPSSCARYGRLEQALRDRADGKAIDSLEDAWRIITRAAGDNTLITVVFRAADRKLLVSFTDGQRGAARIRPAEFSLDELLGQKQ